MASRLEALHRASPARAMREALASPASTDTALFVVNHADLLENLEQVVTAVRLWRAAKPDEPDDASPPALVKRAATLLNGIDHPQPMLMALVALWPLRPDAADGLGQHAWRDLVDLSRKELPKKWWWWLVDWTRGCPLYNALAALPRTPEPIPPVAPWMRLSEMEQEMAKDLPWAFRDFERLAENAAPPCVLDLLDAPDYEARVREVALGLPLEIVLKLHEKGLVSQEDVEEVARKRATDPSSTEDWPVPLPDWLREHAKTRALQCGYPNNLELTRWLDETTPGDVDLVMLGYSQYLAALGVERDPVRLNKIHDEGAYWAKRLGGFLDTGTEWKKLGRKVLELSVDANRGFPGHVLREAIAASKPSTSVTQEQRERAILQQAHNVTAEIFIERASTARRRQEWREVERFLAALSELDCGELVGGRLRALGKPVDGDAGPIPEGVMAWLDACRRILRSGGRAPSEEGLVAAFRVLAEVSP
ncbi:MAG: hypothetical protein U0183_33720 [Polyangiaceae bacterium]